MKCFYIRSFVYDFVIVPISGKSGCSLGIYGHLLQLVDKVGYIQPYRTLTQTAPTSGTEEHPIALMEELQLMEISVTDSLHFRRPDIMTPAISA